MEETREAYQYFGSRSVCRESDTANYRSRRTSVNRAKHLQSLPVRLIAMPETDHDLEAVKIAGEWNKQLSLWATGSVVLSITFMKDLLSGIEITRSWRMDLAIGWSLLVLSIFVGNFAYGAPLTGAGKVTNFKLKVNNATRVLSIVQASLFVFGLACLVVFAVFNLPARLTSGN
jgi:hypothetical protein